MNIPERRRSPDGFDDDAIFADIVAHLNDDAPEPDRAAGPVARDAATDHEMTDETTGSTAEETADPAPGDEEAADPDDLSVKMPPELPTPGDGAPPAVIAPQVWRAHDVDGEQEEHFEPLPVSPLPVGDLQFWAILVGMAGGPLLLVYLVFFKPDVSNYWTLTAIAMSVGGFALLVNRLPGHHDDDDDGARL